MSDKLRATLRDPQRLTARLLLAALLGLLTFMLAASPLGGPLSDVAVSQTASPTASATPSGSPSASPSATPSGSPSASPTGPTGPQIFFLNPAETSSTEISAKPDPFDSSYHLVAWLTQVPASPIVEFKYQDGNREVTIGQGNRVGTTNAFEFDWSSLPDDGTYPLKAVLFSGITEVSRHEMDVEVNNQDGPRELPAEPEPQGETAEFSYPVNGGQVGFHVSGSGDAATTSAIFDVTISDMVDSVSVYYSISAPGTDPDFQSCGNESAANSADGVKCTLNEPDSLTQVTAVAAVAENTDTNSIGGPADPTDDGLDAADAHTVTPYEQIATNVSLSPQSQAQVLTPETGNFPCSQPIVATVLDQNGRLMEGVNVDVSATGPQDSLSFDDSGNNSSAHQAPDMGDHTTEAAVDCESSSSPPPFAGTEGEHERPIGTPDIKHIESAAAGTNQRGQFTFQLFSPDAGGTQFTAWADTDGDDLKCAEEAQGDGSIGWGQGAPLITGLADEKQTCPKPEPSPSPSESPTESPTESPSPSGSPSPSPGLTCPGFENDTRPQIVGTPGDDDLDGTGQDEIICGLGGDDDINGGGGDDLILGGDGNDSIDGGAGNDEIDGGDGKDGIRGSGGNDQIDGGLQNDVIIGNAGNDEISGGNGEDIARGGKDDDEITGGSGTDTLQGGKGGDLLKGNSEDDTVKGGRGHDRLKGGNHNDTIRGGRGNDELLGGKGDDTLRGDPGFDSCNGNAGNDKKFGCES